MSHGRNAFPYFVVFLFLTLFAAFSFAGVSVSSPTNGATVGTSVHYVATASSSCAKGVAGVGIYTADDHLVHVDNGNKLDETISLSPEPIQPPYRSGTIAVAPRKYRLRLTSPAPPMHFPRMPKPSTTCRRRAAGMAMPYCHRTIPFAPGALPADRKLHGRGAKESARRP